MNGPGPAQNGNADGGNGLDWLVNSFIDRTTGASSAIVVTTDGLVLALSERITRDSADQLAAVTSGMASLTAGAARCFDAGPVTQVIVEMAGGFFFITKISETSALAVMCEPTCDIGQIGYEMSLLVTKIGRVLTPAVRTDPQTLHMPQGWPSQ